MAGGNALASGSVVLTANADQMTKGLAEAEAKAEQSFHKTESKLNKASQKFLKKEGGFLGAVGGGLAADMGFGGTLMIITGIALAAKQVGHHVSEWVFSTSAVNKALEESKSKLGDMEEKMTKMAARADEWRAAMSTPEEKGASFDAQISKLEEERAKLKRDLASPFESLVYDTRGDLVTGKGRIFDRKATEEAVKKLTKDIDDLSEKMSEARSPARSAAFLGEINRATEAIEKEIDAWGLSATAAHRASLVKRGALDEQIEALDAAVAKLEGMKTAADEAKAGAEGLAAAMHAMAEDTNRDLAMISDRLGRNRSSNALLSSLNDILRDPKRFDRMEYDERGSGRFGGLGSLLAMGVNSAAATMKPLLEKATKVQPTLAGAVEAGSKEAYSLSMKNQFGAEASQRLVEIKNAITDGTKQMIDILRGIGIVI